MTSRITELESKLAEARHNYYNYEPTVDDATYDAWRDELEELQADNLMVTAIGAEPSSAWPRVKHEVPMGSLDKVNSLDAMTTWIRKFRRNQSEELLLSDKLDGLSVSVIYEGGRLIRGVTRGGDAQVGEDITPNVVRMIGVPKSIEEQSKITFRGEIVLHTDTLAKFFPEYSNTRNGAAGISRRLDGKGCDRLYVYFYRVAQSDKEFEKVSDQFEFLTSSGFLVPRWYVTAMIPGVKTPHDLWVEYQQTIRDSLPYAIDGLVMELNDLEYQESLGMNHLRPVGAVACKFAPITRETVIRSRVDQVGGTGKITPVFGFDPVRVLGAEIQRASLYNQGFVEELKLDIGAKVLVTRANDVIPKVVSVVQGTGTVSQAPSVCPECGTPVVRDGKFILCPNVSECPAQSENRVLRWMKELNIMEWGPALVGNVTQSGLASSIADLYRLTPEKLAELPGMGTISAHKAISNLRGVCPVPLAKFLGGLSIPLCGTLTIQLAIDRGYDTLEKILSISRVELESIPGFGPKRAAAFCTWVSANRDKVLDLLEAGVTLSEAVTGPLTGKSFCFTGTMSMSRDLQKQMAESKGAQVKDRVSKGLTYLVMSDPESSTTKAVKARSQGVVCISEQTFLDMVK